MSNKPEELTLRGLATARGFAMGPVFVYRGDGELSIPEYTVQPGGEAAEILRFQRSRNETRRDLESMIATLKQRAGREEIKVFECHLMFVDDELLVRETEQLILEEHLNAEAAVAKTIDRARAQFARMNDPYFRERVRDLDDVERRLVKSLIGFGGEPTLGLKVPSIIVANDLTPSETVRLPRELVLGFATDGGSTTSHVALLARAMGIPSVAGISGLTERVTPGETMLLDGTGGTVTLHPSPTSVMEFRDLMERQTELSEEVASGAPAGTLKAGGEVLLFANLHPGVSALGLKAQGARGVGLYRSEYLWLNREREPTESEQFEAYCEAVSQTNTLSEVATTTIRLLDIGGDKLVRGITKKEANPFLGNRSIRYLLAHREMLRTQLRAILRASHFGKVCLLYPMIACEEELRELKTELEAVKRQLTSEGTPFDAALPVGAMIEVPAAALNAEALAKYVQFFSIGTNDLVQYTLAADRGNETVSYLYQPTHPAVLRLMEMTVAAAKAHGIKVGVCGESAADPIIGVLWAAMGIDMLSMSATYIPVMAKLFQRLSREDLDAYHRSVKSWSETKTAAEIHACCREWMLAKIPDLDNIVM